MSRILISICNLFLSKQNKLPLLKQVLKPPVEIKINNSDIVVGDIKYQISHTYNTADLRELESLLAWQAYEADEKKYYDCLQLLEGRKLLLDCIEKNFEKRKYSCKELLEAYSTADFDGIHVLQLFVKKHKLEYSDMQLESLDAAYWLRLEQLPNVHSKTRAI